MKRSSLLLSLGALVTSLAALPAASQVVKIPPAKAPAQSPALCAVVSAGVRAEAYGYTHVVTLLNRCDKAVRCEVWTDVDPTPRVTLTAKPGESVEAVTRIGSPAREVSAQKECRFL